jgi:hypothetical protein
MIVAAGSIFRALVANHFGLLRHIWHPTLFEFAVDMPSSIILLVGR